MKAYIIVSFIHFALSSIFLSTHQIREVEPLLDEIVVLREGRIIANEEVENIRAQFGKDTTTWMMSLFREGEENGTTTNR